MGPAFYNNLISLAQSVQDAVDQKRVLPALVLLYAGIDAVAGLDRAPNEGTQAAFRRWVDTYMATWLPCSSLDLYAARCGILHAFSADADLHDRTPARRVYYAWGDATAERLQRMIDHLGKDAIAIHMNDLKNAFFTGLADFELAIQNDRQRYEEAESRAGLWFVNLELEILDEALDLIDTHDV